MGEAHAKARQRLYQAEAQAQLDERVKSRQNTEQMLIQQEMLLGTPGQIAGTLGGGVGQAELPYAGRYQINPALQNQVSAKKYASIESAVGSANDLMAQAQEAARAGNLTLAADLQAQADAAAANFQTGEKSSIMNFITMETDPNLSAITRLQSPLAQAVGQQVATGRAFADPNSAQSQQLFNQVVTQPANEIRQGTQAALGSLQQRTSAALASVDQGFAQALADITGSEMRALSEIDTNFGAALQSLEVGRANSLSEINQGLDYAIQAVQLQAENARRALQAGSRQVQAQAVQGLRQAGPGASRPGVSQAIAARAQEGFATQRAQTFTAQGQQEAALQASAATERAGIEQQTGLAKGELQAQQGALKSGVIMSAAQQRTATQVTGAELEAQINMQAGLAEAQLQQQGALAAADLVSRQTLAVEQFRANYSFAATQNAQAFLQNQAGVREQYQSSLDSLALAQAQLADTAASREFALVQMYTQFDLEWDAMLKEFALGEVAATTEGGRQIGQAWATFGQGVGDTTNPAFQSRGGGGSAPSGPAATSFQGWV